MYYNLLGDALRSVVLATDETLILLAVVPPFDRDPRFVDLGWFSRGDPRKYLYDYLRWQITEEYLPASHHATWKRLLDKVDGWSDLQALSVADARNQVSNFPRDAPLLVELERIGLLRSPAAEPDPQLVSALVAYSRNWFRDQLEELLRLQEGHAEPKE